MAEKRAESFDKVVGEWKIKVQDLSNELEASQRECRNYNSEVFRLRAGWEEVNEQLDAVKRENKNLAEEIKDLLDQLGELFLLKKITEERHKVGFSSYVFQSLFFSIHNQQVTGHNVWCNW